MGIGPIYRHELFSVAISDSLLDASCRLRTNDVGALMVLDGDTFVGIFTERDLARAIAAGEMPAEARVGDYVTTDPITVQPSTGVREAAAQMLEADVRHLPVERAGRVVGVISLRDLLPIIVEDRLVG
jgi:CBS domain-containing protein